MKNLDKEYSPYLIFPEFIKEKWKFLPLKNIATIRSERAGNKKCILLSVSSGVGLISQKEKFGREIAGKQYERYFLVHENDFVYNKSSTKIYPQGTINLYYNKELAAVPSSIFTCFYVDCNIINVFYLKYLFEFNIHGKWLKKFITTGSRAHGSFNIDSKDFLSIPIPIPLGEKSLSEQQKIADCLSSLDELIDAHMQKLGALKQHKKGLMQRLFPAEGETTPRWRFPEFRNNGEWKTRSLGSMTQKIGSGVTPRGGDKNYISSGIPFVRSQNIGWGKLLLDDIVFISYEIHKTFLSTEIQYQDVLLNITGASIGRCAIANRQISGGNVNQHVCIIRINKNELNPIFLMQYIISYQCQNQINNFQAGGNRQGLNFAQVASFNIPKTSLPEQQKIADCLTSLDERIKAQEEQIAALKEHKKGMMQQLFPSL